MVNVLPAGIPSPRGMTFEGASAALLGDLLRVRSVEDSYRTQDWQTDYQVVSLCTPVVWWIDAIRRGWYRYRTSTGTWDRDMPACH